MPLPWKREKKAVVNSEDEHERIRNPLKVRSWRVAVRNYLDGIVHEGTFLFVIFLSIMIFPMYIYVDTPAVGVACAMIHYLFVAYFVIIEALKMWAWGLWKGVDYGDGQPIQDGYFKSFFNWWNFVVTIISAIFYRQIIFPFLRLVAFFDSRPSKIPYLKDYQLIKSALLGACYHLLIWYAIILVCIFALSIATLTSFSGQFDQACYWVDDKGGKRLMLVQNSQGRQFPASPCSNHTTANYGRPCSSYLPKIADGTNPDGNRDYVCAIDQSLYQNSDVNQDNIGQAFLSVTAVMMRDPFRYLLLGMDNVSGIANLPFWICASYLSRCIFFPMILGIFVLSYEEVNETREPVGEDLEDLVEEHLKARRLPNFRERPDEEDNLKSQRRMRVRKMFRQLMENLAYNFAMFAIYFADCCVICLNYYNYQPSTHPTVTDWLIALNFVFASLYTTDLLFGIVAYGFGFLLKPRIVFNFIMYTLLWTACIWSVFTTNGRAFVLVYATSAFRILRGVQFAWIGPSFQAQFLLFKKYVRRLPTILAIFLVFVYSSACLVAIAFPDVVLYTVDQGGDKTWAVDSLNSVLNFETFWNAFITTFVITTGQFWAELTDRVGSEYGKYHWWPFCFLFIFVRTLLIPLFVAMAIYVQRNYPPPPKTSTINQQTDALVAVLSNRDEVHVPHTTAVTANGTTVWTKNDDTLANLLIKDRTMRRLPQRTTSYGKMGNFQMQKNQNLQVSGDCHSGLQYKDIIGMLLEKVEMIDRQKRIRTSAHPRVVNIVLHPKYWLFPVAYISTDFIATTIMYALRNEYGRTEVHIGNIVINCLAILCGCIDFGMRLYVYGLKFFDSAKNDIDLFLGIVAIVGSILFILEVTVIPSMARVLRLLLWVPSTWSIMCNAWQRRGIILSSYLLAFLIELTFAAVGMLLFKGRYNSCIDCVSDPGDVQNLGPCVSSPSTIYCTLEACEQQSARTWWTFTFNYDAITRSLRSTSRLALFEAGWETLLVYGASTQDRESTCLLTAVEWPYLAFYFLVTVVVTGFISSGWLLGTWTVTLSQVTDILGFETLPKRYQRWITCALDIRLRKVYTTKSFMKIQKILNSLWYGLLTMAFQLMNIGFAACWAYPMNGKWIYTAVLISASAFLITLTVDYTLRLIVYNKGFFSYPYRDIHILKLVFILSCTYNLYLLVVYNDENQHPVGFEVWPLRAIHYMTPLEIFRFVPHAAPLFKAVQRAMREIFVLLVAVLVMIIIFSLVGIEIFGDTNCRKHPLGVGLSIYEINRDCFNSWDAAFTNTFLASADSAWPVVAEELSTQWPYCRNYTNAEGIPPDCGKPIIAQWYFYFLNIITYTLLSLTVPIMIKALENAFLFNDPRIREFEFMTTNWTLGDPDSTGAMHCEKFFFLFRWWMNLDPNRIEPDLKTLMEWSIPVCSNRKVYYRDVFKSFLRLHFDISVINCYYLSVLAKMEGAVYPDIIFMAHHFIAVARIEKWRKDVLRRKAEMGKTWIKTTAGIQTVLAALRTSHTPHHTPRIGDDDDDNYEPAEPYDEGDVFGDEYSAVKYPLVWKDYDSDRATTMVSFNDSDVTREEADHVMWDDLASQASDGNDDPKGKGPYVYGQPVKDTARSNSTFKDSSEAASGVGSSGTSKNPLLPPSTSRSSARRKDLEMNELLNEFHGISHAGASSIRRLTSPRNFISKANLESSGRIGPSRDGEMEKMLEQFRQK